MKKGLYYSINQFRKEKYFNSFLFKSKKKYAFIGVGMHSLTNFYPLIIHFGINLKYIFTKKSSWERELSGHFPNCSFVHSLDILLNDPEIEGVFVCAHPDAHAGILTELLKKGKKVFIEKPPCSSLKELEDLIEIDKAAICKVGLQRNYWPGNKFVNKKIQSARSYLYQFYFGSYPLGDVFNELFIHAVDYSRYLFGEFTVKSASNRRSNEGITSQMHVTHNNGISGLLELSTHYSWNNPVDLLSINCNKERLIVQYPILVSGLQKPGRLLNIPAERILQQPVITRDYFSSGSMVVPAIELNTLFLQGFYGEFEAFINLVENDSGDVRNDLIKLKSVYRVLDELKKLPT